MKKILFFAFLTICSFVMLNAQQKKQIVKNETGGKNYLIIIAIDKYFNRLPLDRCIKEAADFKNTVYAEYLFDEMFEIYDNEATFGFITDFLKKLQKTVNENDTILIYFNGHGYIEQSAKEGYWILYDSGINEQLKDNWLSNTELLKLLNKIKAKNKAIISESCFSSNYIIEELKKIPKEDEEYFKAVLEKKSAVILSSGKLETGSEESQMTKEIVKFFKLNNKKLTDLLILFNDIKFKIKDSKPVYGYLKDFDHEKDGGFIFFLRNEPVDMKEFEKSKEPEIKQDEKDKVKDKDKTVKKDKKTQYITQLQPNEVKILNRTSLVLLITGSTFTVIGSGLLIYDILVLFNEVRKYTTEENYYSSYIQYEQAYNRNLIVFCTSVSVLGTGLCLLAASLSLKIYASVKKKQITMNINLGQTMEITMSIKF